MDESSAILCWILFNPDCCKIFDHFGFKNSQESEATLASFLALRSKFVEWNITAAGVSFWKPTNASTSLNVPVLSKKRRNKSDRIYDTSMIFTII